MHDLNLHPILMSFEPKLIGNSDEWNLMVTNGANFKE